MSIADGLNQFRGAFREELGTLRAGLSDQGGGDAGLGRLQSFERQGGAGLGDYLGGRLGGWDAAGGAGGGLDRLAPGGFDTGAQYSRFATGFAVNQDAAQRQARRDAEQQALSGRSRTAVEAGDWSGPATADDNRTLDAGKIDSWIVATRPNSPLRGMGGYILQQANAAGVSVPLLMGILLKESELGTTAGPGYNIAGVGGEGNFAQYGSWQQALDGAIRNLAGPTYKGKSAEEQVGNWFVGPQAWAQGGLNATDSTGGRNGTVGTYLNGPVAAAYGGLGVPFNQGVAGTRRAGGGAGAQAGDTFPVVGWSGTIQNHWGTDERGATDIMAPEGAPIVAVRGGRVTWVGYDGLGGNSVMIHDDATGLDFYYAHMRDAPLVQVGQTLNSGAPLGFVGNTGDAAGGPTHLHLGIGYGIIQGGGASGGAGKDFDAVGFLQGIYSRPRQAAPQGAYPGGGSGERNY